MDTNDNYLKDDETELQYLARTAAATFTPIPGVGVQPLTPASPWVVRILGTVAAFAMLALWLGVIVGTAATR